MRCTCPSFLHHLTCGGRQGYFLEGWTLGLLTAACANADAQAAHAQAWLHWLALDYGMRAWCVRGSLN